MRIELLFGIALIACDPGRAQRIEGGTVVHRAQTLRGIEVVGRGVTVRYDDYDRALWSDDRTLSIDTSMDLDPERTESDAVARALAWLDTFGDGEARPVLLPTNDGAPVLAWRVLLPPVPGRAAARVYVDDATGRIRSVEHLQLFAGEANVFEHNPIVSSEMQATLPGLPPGAKTLANDDVITKSCIDTQICTEYTGQDGRKVYVQMCDDRSRVLADDAGDFTAYERPTSDRDSTDGFAEVQAYYHVTNTLAWFRGLGFTELRTRPIELITNDRSEGALCDGPNAGVEMSYYNNAAFSFDPSGTEPDQLIFGQGEFIDFAYDGDLVAHETTHAVMTTVGELAFILADHQGYDPSPLALHEGFADFMTAAMTGDPEWAEYLKLNSPWVETESAGTRSLINDRRCPEQLTGEPHDDGMIWSGALWEIRSGVSDQEAFDRAVYTVLTTLVESDSFETVRAKMIAELEARLGEAAATLATEKFRARGLENCERVVSMPTFDGTGVVSGPSMTLLPAGTFGGRWSPAHLQGRIELTETATVIDLIVGGSMADSLHFKCMRLLLKKDVPIEWQHGADGPTHDATLIAEPLPSPDADPDFPSLDRHVRFDGQFEAGTYYVQPMNGAASLAEITLYAYGTTSPLPAEQPAFDETECFTGVIRMGPDAGPAMDAMGGSAADAMISPMTLEEEGCGCQAVHHGDRSLAWVLLLAGLAIGLRRSAISESARPRSAGRDRCSPARASDRRT